MKEKYKFGEKKTRWGIGKYIYPNEFTYGTCYHSHMPVHALAHMFSNMSLYNFFPCSFSASSVCTRDDGWEINKITLVKKKRSLVCNL